MSDRTYPGPSSIIVFGEVLFDCFADGREVLGGAPFNVAWHLTGFGARPLVISRVGNDERGRRILDTMADWGMRRDGIQVDPDRPTGVVTATVEDGQPSFDIPPDQAYDFIQIDEGPASAVAGPGILYHGSLVLRTEAPRASLERLKSQGDRSVFIDVNLRDPWWNHDGIEAALGGARWVKLSDGELTTLSGDGCDSAESCVEAGRAFARRHSIPALIVTRGAEGAVWLETDHRPARAEPRPVENLVDTVGAGDAFAAVSILGAVRGWPSPQILERAVEFAAVVCGFQGATVFDRDLYRQIDDGWAAAGDGRDRGGSPPGGGQAP